HHVKQRGASPPPLVVPHRMSLLASSATARGVNEPFTVREAKSPASASCLRTVSAVGLADKEITPAPSVGPRTTESALPTGVGVPTMPPPLSQSMTVPSPFQPTHSPMQPFRWPK